MEKSREIVYEFWTKEVAEGTIGGVSTMFLATIIDANLLFYLGALGTLSLWGLNVYYIVLKIRSEKRRRKNGKD